MITKIKSCSLFGIEGVLVDVEVDSSQGFPSFNIVGLPDNAVKESKERVRLAIKNSKLPFPNGRVTINLAPADIKKEGSGFDLPIAIGILSNNGIINNKELNDYLFLGELSLTGELNRVKGVLPITLKAKQAGFKGIILPDANAYEAGIISDINVYGFNNLVEIVKFLNNEVNKEEYKIEKDINAILTNFDEYELDFKDVKGQHFAKRAVEIAAAGAHNILMIGPPGSGKTMIAKRIPSILPPMTFEEALETSIIHSVAGLLSKDKFFVTKRPFEAPHSTISDIALIGGGSIPKPGAISIAHNGVLFLDEFPEFKKSVLEVLRQPLEDGKVTISRASMTVTFPSKFMLVAAMNPCKCGYYGSQEKECTCTPNEIRKYQSRISGPLMDRIDIHIEVPSVKYDDLIKQEEGEPSYEIRKRVVKAREIQLERFKNEKIYNNSQMREKHLKKYCKLNSKCLKILEMAIRKMGFSARAYSRIIKVARTIADLDNSIEIKENHILEAIQYRSFDKEKYFI